MSSRLAVTGALLLARTLHLGMDRFGKDLADLYWLHDDLQSNEELLLELQRSVESQYLNSPIRQRCVLCDTTLTGSADFIRNTISFIFCVICGHVNGNHEVSLDFIASTYTSVDQSSRNSSLYSKEFTTGKKVDEYWEVVERIDQPKARFLAEFVHSLGLRVGATAVLDVGCGSGHFVNALLREGFTLARGFDSFAPAIATAQTVGNLSNNQAYLEEPNELLGILAETEATVISMMCVLVHLDSPLAALRAMRDNPSIRFTYQKIPMWSFATILEAALPGFHARVLGSDHSNVFSHESLKWIEGELGLKRVASWTFGGDWLDLQKRILLGMQKNDSSDLLLKRASLSLGSIANDVQQIFDKNKLASELHLVWEFE